MVEPFQEIGTLADKMHFIRAQGITFSDKFFPLDGITLNKRLLNCEVLKPELID